MSERPQTNLEEVFRPPIADDPVPLAGAQLTSRPFYVVSPAKFLLLFFGTLGVYSLYWFYKHWKTLAARTNQDIYPFWRAVFSIFFAHSLFSQMQSRALERDTSRRRTLGSMATLYVVLTIASHILEKVASETEVTIVDAVGVVVGLAVGYPLYQAQLAANVACDDAEGIDNSRINALNYVFLTLGLLMWVMMIIGFLSGDVE